MEAVQINLVGFSEAEITDLRQRLEAIATVREEGLVSGLQAHGVHEALESVLANTTLIAEITSKLGEAALGVGTIFTAIKQWRSSVKERPGQEVNVSGPHADGAGE